jgi:hypothetical protein
MSDYWKEMEKTTTAPATGAATTFLVPTNAKLNRQTLGAAGWLFAMSAMSGVNLVLTFVNAPIRFPVSFFLTELLFAVGREFNSILTGVALVLDIGFIGFVVMLGFFAKAHRRWAIITGIVLLAVDMAAVYFLTTLDGLSTFIWHGVAILMLFMGASAAKVLTARKQLGQA